MAGAAEEATVELLTKVEEVIAIVRPIIQQDAGDVVLHGVDEDSGVVTVELVGACVTCPASSQTLKAGLERILKDRVPGITEVVNVGETLPGLSESAVSL